MTKRAPTDTLTDNEINALRAAIRTQGEAQLARAIGIDSRTLCRAIAGCAVHRMTVVVIRALTPDATRDTIIP